MRLLLDTHALIWWLLDDRALSRPAYAAIEDQGNEVVVSAISGLEVTTKHRLGKLPQAERLARRFEAEIADAGFVSLPVSATHAAFAGALAIPHKDPFDRLLIAQSMLESLPLISNEEMFEGFGVSRLW